MEKEGVVEESRSSEFWQISFNLASLDEFANTFSPGTSHFIFHFHGVLGTFSSR